jgi:hypothetical protein
MFLATHNQPPKSFSSRDGNRIPNAASCWERARKWSGSAALPDRHHSLGSVAHNNFTSADATIVQGRIESSVEQPTWLHIQAVGNTHEGVNRWHDATVFHFADVRRGKACALSQLNLADMPRLPRFENG